MTLDVVAFDIETTGFTVGDEVTVAGFALELGARVFYQTGGRPADPVEKQVREAATQPVHVSAHDSEAELFDAMTGFVAERLADRDVLLVAFNGETWRGGFDVPFLRTRYAAHDAAWPFTDVPYADLLPVVTDRFNTTRAGSDTGAGGPESGAATADEPHTVGGTDGDDAGAEQVTRRDLDGVYETLCNGRVGDLDPFADSAEAVEAFAEARFGELVLHNVADILRTRALGVLAHRYCSKSDFAVKSLTAAHDA
ncbi:hypothetical protein GCM10008995_01990 [Halobellus salinus]|uniref:Uncharacterized protein n=1 Tax=Halobellus salinus TaxID=931585 RepID=A0A830EBZ8_9EURY|nr:hypothetical protein [Halobellus salinus]GGI95485.1 hypothetical protein GCM10008995_01990 [Halobellus salinus]SMP12365.1 hypothetical protein SAMN06265347_10445 [Halobellus salinus]